jgi:LuxR family maltose regulon positive regulatory protein
VADLRLDEREAGVLLQGAGVELDPAGVADLTGRTEGWPAGLYLAALSLQAGSPGPARAETFTGEDRFVSEYLRYELLSRLPGAEARFLTHTSVLDRMCGGLCDAMLQTTRSAATLESLERSQRFRGAARPAGRVVPLPPPVRPAAAQRARAERPHSGGGA